jgi:hypothetical protein
LLAAICQAALINMAAACFTLYFFPLMSWGTTASVVTVVLFPALSVITAVMV